METKGWDDIPMGAPTSPAPPSSDVYPDETQRLLARAPAPNRQESYLAIENQIRALQQRQAELAGAKRQSDSQVFEAEALRKQIAALREQLPSEWKSTVGGVGGALIGGALGATTLTPVGVAALSTYGSLVGTLAGAMQEAKDQNMTPEEKVSYLRRKGIESVVFDTVGNIVFLGGGKVIGKIARDTAPGKWLMQEIGPAVKPASAVEQSASALVERTAGSQSQEFAGGALQESLRMAEGAAKNKFGPVFSELSDPKGPFATGLVDVRGLKAKAAERVDQEARGVFMEDGERKFLQSITSLPDTITPDIAHSIQSNAGKRAGTKADQAANPLNAMFSEYGQGMREALDQGLDTAAKSGKLAPEQIERLGQARAAYRDVHDVVYSDPMREVLRATPERGASKLYETGNVTELRAVERLNDFAKRLDSMTVAERAEEAKRLGVSVEGRSISDAVQEAQRGVRSEYLATMFKDTKSIADFTAKLADPRAKRTFMALFPDEADRAVIEALSKEAQRTIARGERNDALAQQGIKLFGVGITFPVLTKILGDVDGKAALLKTLRWGMRTAEGTGGSVTPVGSAATPQTIKDAINTLRSYEEQPSTKPPAAPAASALQVASKGWDDIPLGEPVAAPLKAEGRNPAVKNVNFAATDFPRGQSNKEGRLAILQSELETELGKSPRNENNIAALRREIAGVHRAPNY